MSHQHHVHSNLNADGHTKDRSFDLQDPLAWWRPEIPVSLGGTAQGLAAPPRPHLTSIPRHGTDTGIGIF